MLRLWVHTEEGDRISGLIDAQSPSTITVPYKTRLIGYKLTTIAGNSHVGAGALDLEAEAREKFRFVLGTDEVSVSIVSRVLTRVFTPEDISVAVADLQSIARGIAAEC